ncbi:hypothetical protein [Isachenkonia alkalipeptolytica]|uniref:Uncharacterized protein n=1 Tax=Isachenkonia alkalipeptolytica TaxID=2565777 RepID=A0AA44BEG8_9CLOT|nr:hypothetical protein [Isachenkonia alkalipeptolytica]NBG89264.1 hypothetical protein [Isachenkonia alkalipeptolytica]
MFCKCFSPGKKAKISKSIVLHLEGKDIDIGEVTVEICGSRHCKEGYIEPERWKEIYEIVKKEDIDISEVALSRILFSYFR